MKRFKRPHNIYFLEEGSCFRLMSIPAFLRTQQLNHGKNSPVENLEMAYEITRRVLQERADHQVDVNASRPFPSYQPGDQVLVHRPYFEADGPSLKLISSWRESFVVRSRLVPVIYRVSKSNQPEETSVHLARIKPYHAPSVTSASDFDY